MTEKNDIGQDLNEEIAEKEEKIEKEDSIEKEENTEINDKNGKEDKKEKKKKADKKLEKFQKEIDELKETIKEHNDKYLRLMAEYDNFRRRAKEEKEATYSEAYAEAIKEILPIIDNLERAQAYGEGEKILEGLSMTFKAFGATLEKLGVEEIECKPGDKFDPNLHNAVMHTEDESAGENTITNVLAKGYKLGDKIIRPAMVAVAN